MMLSIQRRMETMTWKHSEKDFLAGVMSYLTVTSGQIVQPQTWMITAYEVEFEHEVGFGRLSVFLSNSVSKDGILPGGMKTARKSSKVPGTKPRLH